MSERHGTSRTAAPPCHIAWSRDPVSGESLYLSATVREFIGADESDDAGWAALMSAVHPDDVALFDPASGAGAPADVTFEFRYRRRGELRWGTARILRTGGRLDGVILDVTDRVRAEEAISADQRRADALSTVASKISERLEVPDIARVLCAAARKAFGEHVRATFLLYEPESASFVPVHHEGDPPGSIEQPKRFPSPRPRVVESDHHERILYMPDRSDSAESQVAATVGARGVAGAYVISGDTLLGCLSLATFDRPLLLDPVDLDLLRGMADQAASAVNNARVLAESRLNAQQYRNIVETVFDGINITGADNVIRYCNPQFAAMLGTTPDVIVGKTSQDLLFPEDLPEANERIRRRLAGLKTPFTWRLRALDDGREVMVRANGRVIRDERGVPIATLGVVSDITAAHRLEEKLLQAQKLESLGVLAGGVAHDFNNLLVGILGNATLALMELDAASPVRPLIAEMQKAATRAADLTRQLLSYSGRGRFVLTALDLGRAVDEMHPLLESACAKGVTVRFQLAPTLPLIEGDAAQIRQVVLSLVANASDAMSERGGEVTVTTSVVNADSQFLSETIVDDQLAAGDYVCLAVSDTGHGMSAETITKIFDPFYTTKFVGRGLGLAAVLGILRGHKGAVAVQSEPGKGTTLRAFFPSLAGANDAPARRPAARASGARTILIIDDEESVRAVARRIFERAKFNVIVACDGVEGVERFRERPDEIAAVLLDVTMPRMGGEDTFEALRRIRADVRVVLTSGYSEQDAMSRFAGKGLAGFVEKPFLPQTLLDKLNAVLNA